MRFYEKAFDFTPGMITEGDDVDAGAKIVYGPEEAFWGNRFVQLEDPDGHLWGTGKKL